MVSIEHLFFLPWYNSKCFFCCPHIINLCLMSHAVICLPCQKACDLFYLDGISCKYTKTAAENAAEQRGV